MLSLVYGDVAVAAGLDEAGRGCLAGPVVAAAVILDKSCVIAGLDDSKRLSPKVRARLRAEIEEKADSFSVSFASAAKIDAINILDASIYAMHQAIAALIQKPEFLLIDGNRFHPYPGIPHRCIVKGDTRYASIAAASILAKTHRDAHMVGLHESHPEYDWIHNKGYPTRKHRIAIARYGMTPQHRRSFSCKPLPTDSSTGRRKTCALIHRKGLKPKNRAIFSGSHAGGKTED